MEFWGIEVKPGETVKCEPGDDKYLHLSQASLGESKKDKGSESVPLYLKFDDKQLVIGTLSADRCPQITYDLVFEKEFELHHSWKNGSVFFVGYKTEIPDEGPDDFMEDFDSESEEEETPVKKEANGKPKPKEELAKPKANAPKAKSEEIKKEKKEDEDDDSDDDEDESDEDESDDEDMLDAGGNSSDEEEDESDEEGDEETPNKPEIGKKRGPESVLKTPATDKKAKLSGGGQKTGGTDGKKGGHTATPHPAKRAGKTLATNEKSKQQTPKSTGSVSCKSCPKTFKDDNALQSHTKAKHAGK